MTRPGLGLSVALAALMALSATPAFGQIESARIQGVVSDATGAVIPGATVRFVHVETGQQFEVSTTADGLYRSIPLRIGEFRVEYEADGFKRSVRSGINLELQETAVIDVVLEIGELTEVVDVTADAVLLETTEATQGQVINNQRIVDMPLNGRDYIQLALLSAGAIRPIGGRFGGYSAGGQRTTQNNYTLDGIDNNGLQIAAQGRRAEVVKPSVDAIEEFKISTNAYSAESGRALGGTVNVSIKSGTNQFHGTVFEFLRNDVLDAKNFFDDPDSPKPPFKRNQFGYSVGGPIRRNSTFFFTDFEGTRIRESATFVETIPTQEQLAGDFSGVPQTIYDPATYDSASNLRDPFQNNTIPSDRIDSVARSASAFYPAPNTPGLTRNWRTAGPDKEDDDKWDVRLDQIISANDNVFGRYSQQDSYVPTPNRFPSLQDGNGTEFNHRGQNLAVGWNHIFSPTLITNFKVGWNRIYTNRQALAHQPRARAHRGQPVPEWICPVRHQRHAPDRHLELHAQSDRFAESPDQHRHKLDQGPPQHQVRVLAPAAAELPDKPPAGAGTVRLQRELLKADPECRGRQGRPAGSGLPAGHSVPHRHLQFGVHEPASALAALLPAGRMACQRQAHAQPWPALRAQHALVRQGQRNIELRHRHEPVEPDVFRGDRWQHSFPGYS